MFVFGPRCRLTPVSPHRTHSWWGSGVSEIEPESATYRANAFPQPIHASYLSSPMIFCKFFCIIFFFCPYGASGFFSHESIFRGSGKVQRTHIFGEKDTVFPRRSILSSRGVSILSFPNPSNVCPKSPGCHIALGKLCALSGPELGLGLRNEHRAIEYLLHSWSRYKLSPSCWGTSVEWGGSRHPGWIFLEAFPLSPAPVN